MNKEIREILQITKELEQSSNFKLADVFTNSLVKLARQTTFTTVKSPTLVEPMTGFKPTNTSKQNQGFPAFLSSFYNDLVQNNESIKPVVIEQKKPEKTKKLNEDRSKKALKILSLVKKPNNIYSDYVNNSPDEKLKELNKTVSGYTPFEVVFHILNMNDSSVYIPSRMPKIKNILLWAYKMHIINVIPQDAQITGYSRSGKKPGEKQDKKTDQKLNFKTKENKTLPRMPTLPTTTPERVEEKKQEEKKETTTSPVLKPFVEPTPLLSPTISPMISTPMRTKFLPEESPELLTTEIMTPILSPKREKETTYGPMNWNEFLNFLNPSMPSAQAPINTLNQSSQTANPSNLETKPPVPPAQGSDQKTNQNPKTDTLLPLDLKSPELGFAKPGGIAFMTKEDYR